MIVWSAMLNTNNDNSDRFNIGKVNLLLCRNLQDKRYIFIVLRRSPKLFLKKSRLRRTYDTLFFQTENSNESSVILFCYCGESMRLI